MDTQKMVTNGRCFFVFNYVLSFVSVLRSHYRLRNIKRCRMAFTSLNLRYYLVTLYHF